MYFRCAVQRTGYFLSH